MGVSQHWPWAIRRLSQMPWPARPLAEVAFQRRFLARVPWAAAEPAAHALQPFLASLPSDVCAMLVPFCAGVENPSQDCRVVGVDVNACSFTSPISLLSSISDLKRDVVLGIAILSVQF